ncbi:MAG: UDP-3-O-(3-hydroxymyristoyl)glucosamine N-acyltransferase [Gammaproteobacteria bacterium]|nr:UDP-3-O-(3-hydroxymyristoyl)glucosamine N-acyltransferase [Gammaproteobacteria bacterium]
MTYRVRELAREIGVDVVGDGDAEITHVADLDDSNLGSLSFAVSSQYKNKLKHTMATAVIVPEELVSHCKTTALISKNPYLSFARAAKLLHPEEDLVANIHPSSVINDECEIADNVYIGPNVVICAKCTIERDCYIGPGTVITAPSIIGASSRLIARVSIVGPAIIGERVIIHPGAVIASDGFGLANDNGVWEKIPQLGGVVLGDDVEIGANTTIDRGALKDTVIKKGAKLDNQIQIAHNVIIGEHTAIAGCTGIAGSTVIGKHCAIGAAAGIQGHLTIADGVQVSGMTAIRKSITKPGLYSSGTAAEDNKSWLRNATRFKDLDALFKRVNGIIKKLESIDKGK